MPVALENAGEPIAPCDMARIGRHYISLAMEEALGLSQIMAQIESINRCN